MPAQVNLDALIRRENFDTRHKGAHKRAKRRDVITISELAEEHQWRKNLRKPDFQRATNEWTPLKIRNFIQSFIEEDFIPALVLWESDAGYVFTIDGAHRISAILSWLQDDYGDGPTSRAFFGANIPQRQLKLAEQTRSLIDGSIGAYRNLTGVRLRRLQNHTISIQWEAEGDARKAERSFFRINCEASPIN